MDTVYSEVLCNNQNVCVKYVLLHEHSRSRLEYTPGWNVIDAHYGLFDRSEGVDVTHEVQQLLKTNGHVQAGNDINGDPAPKQHKCLQVTLIANRANLIHIDTTITSMTSTRCCPPMSQFYRLCYSLFAWVSRYKARSFSAETSSQSNQGRSSSSLRTATTKQTHRRCHPVAYLVFGIMLGINLTLHESVLFRWLRTCSLRRRIFGCFLLSRMLTVILHPTSTRSRTSSSTSSSRRFHRIRETPVDIPMDTPKRQLQLTAPASSTVCSTHDCEQACHIK